MLRAAGRDARLTAGPAGPGGEDDRGPGGDRRCHEDETGSHLASQEAQHTVKWAFEHPAVARQICWCTRTIREPVRNAEFGRINKIATKQSNFPRQIQLAAKFYF
ncbi:MAG: hypothetical protein NVS9B8_13640 [Candidatus Limnocylindrales bacterium]